MPVPPHHEPQRPPRRLSRIVDADPRPHRDVGRFHRRAARDPERRAVQGHAVQLAADGESLAELAWAAGQVWIEVKTGGAVPTERQLQSHALLRDCGQKVLVVRSLEELEAGLRSVGAPVMAAVG